MSRIEAPSGQVAHDRDDVLKVLTFGLAVGESMLESSIATSDVEELLRRLTASFGLGHCEVSITLNVITMCLLHSTEGPITLVKVVDIGEPRLDRVIALEQLGRDVEAGRVDIEEATRQVGRLRTESTGVVRWVRLLALTVSVAAWVVFAGGGLVGAAAGLLGALVIELTVLPLARTKLPVVFVGMLAAFVAVSAPSVFAWLDAPIVLGPAIIGGLYPLLPGGLLVASVSDGLSGAPLSAMAKGLQAAVAATATAVGVLAALDLVARLGITSDAVAGPPPDWLVASSGAIAVAALGVARSMPTALVMSTAGLAAGSWAIARWAGDGAAGLSIGVLAAAGALGLGAQVAARLHRTPAVVFISVAVFVLVPGVTFYLSMLAFSQGNSSSGAELLIRSLGVAASIAAGVGLGSAIGRSVPEPRPRVRVWRPRSERSGAGGVNVPARRVHFSPRSSR